MSDQKSTPLTIEIPIDMPEPACLIDLEPGGTMLVGKTLWIGVIQDDDNDHEKRALLNTSTHTVYSLTSLQVLNKYGVRVAATLVAE